MEAPIKPWPAILLSLAACGNQPASSAMTNAAARDGPKPEAAATLHQAAPSQACAMPRLDFRSSGLGSTERTRFTDNFQAAFGQACAEGLLAGAKLVDPRAYAKDTIHVVNSPNANVTSIYYASSAAPPAMLLESPIGDPPQVPSVEDLHEAIYCAVKGATEQEQETTGRCLPD